MNILFMWVATLLYLLQAILFIHDGKNPQAMMLFGYVVANLGLIWSVKL